MGWSNGSNSIRVGSEETPSTRESPTRGTLKIGGFCFVFWGQARGRRGRLHPRRKRQCARGTHPPTRAHAHTDTQQAPHTNSQRLPVSHSTLDLWSHCEGATADCNGDCDGDTAYCKRDTSHGTPRGLQCNFLDLHSAQHHRRHPAPSHNRHRLRPSPAGVTRDACLHTSPARPRPPATPPRRPLRPSRAPAPSPPPRRAAPRRARPAGPCSGPAAD